MAMASTRADSVMRFTEKPMRFMPKKVPTRATGMAMAGMMVERKSCRKTYTTKNTRMKASMRVLITSWMEALRKSLLLRVMANSVPLGSAGFILSISFIQSLMICVALEPAVWKTIHDVAGYPLRVLAKPYITRPSSTSAMSPRRSTSPLEVARTTMFSNCSGCSRRPRYRMGYWNDWLPCSPNEPGAASRFCSARAAETSEGIRPYWAITSGLSQIRIE